MKPAGARPILVIGYGNSLRGDDALGRLVAERIEQERLPRVSVVSIEQLMPELAERIAESHAVVFVDACLADRVGSVVMHEISDASHFHGASHESGPRELLTLAGMCFGRCPKAWLVAVPACQFELRDGLSPEAERVVKSAVGYVRAFLTEHFAEG